MQALWPNDLYAAESVRASLPDQRLSDGGRARRFRHAPRGRAHPPPGPRASRLGPDADARPPRPPGLLPRGLRGAGDSPLVRRRRRRGGRGPRADDPAAAGNWLTRTIGPLWAGPAHPVARRLREGDEVGGSPSWRRRALRRPRLLLAREPTACSSSAMSWPTSAHPPGSGASASPRVSSRPTRPRIAARPAGSPPWSRSWSASATGRPWPTRGASSNSSDASPSIERRRWNRSPGRAARGWNGP